MKNKKDFRFLFIICLTLVVAKPGFSQITVDAGKDTTYCTGFDTLYLGNNVTIDNGVEPYSIKWECKIPKGLYSFYTASDVLNDSSVINPYFIYTPSNAKWEKFILHVTDSKNNCAKDSIKIRFSKFAYLTGYIVVEVEKGDSILFHEASVGGGIEPLQFHWQPKIGLSNPDTLVTWCKPDSAIQYDVVAVDSCGCVSNPNLVYDVRMLPTELNDLNQGKDVLNIRQSKSKIYFNNPLNKEAYITLYSINGRARYNFRTTDDHFEIANLLKTKGIYVVKISVGDSTGSNKFIKY